MTGANKIVLVVNMGKSKTNRFKIPMFATAAFVIISLIFAPVSQAAKKQENFNIAKKCNITNVVVTNSGSSDKKTHSYF